MATTGLTVAVTGPTGDLGLGIVDALERSRSVKRIVGMARRPFEPGDRGWRKTEYRQGDVTDEASVRDLVQGADVVVHLAFAILSASNATRELNVEGSRRVFERAAQRHRGVGLPPLHRGRTRGAHDAPGDPVLPARRGDARRGGAPARLGAGAETGAPGPRHALPARARGGRGERLRARRARG